MAMKPSLPDLFRTVLIIRGLRVELKELVVQELKRGAIKLTDTTTADLRDLIEGGPPEGTLTMFNDVFQEL